MKRSSIHPTPDLTEPNDTHQNGIHGGRLHAIWGVFSDYANNSSIHGIRYIGERKRPWIERVWWIIALIISIYGCSRLILNVWTKWDQSPVIVSFSEKSTPVWQIPFPAVTICAETKTQANLFNCTEMFHMLNGFTDNSQLNNLTIEEKLSFEAVSQVCDEHWSKTPYNGSATIDPGVVQMLEKLRPKLNPNFFTCKWRNEEQDKICNMFEKILTDDGMCMTFNSLNANETFREENLHKDYQYLFHNIETNQWNLETGYSSESEIYNRPYPYRVMSAGFRAGLVALLPLYKYDLDYSCRGPMQGFKVQLHTPGDIPCMSKQFFRVPLNQEVVVAIRPNMITTSEELRHYDPHRRQCYFNGERYLHFFKIYSQQNCQLECLTNFTLKMCKCVRFSMPRNESTPVCGSRKIPCLHYAEDILLRSEQEQGMRSLKDNNRVTTLCNCLPSCTSITYDAETSQADYDWKKLLDVRNEPLGGDKEIELARLSIYFKESQFITSKRSELYGLTDFIANCGGLLGLFMGFSLLSIVEIVYYLTIRLSCTLLRAKKARRLNSDRKVQEE